MDSQWIASHRHHQVHKYVPSLVTSSLHVSRSLYPIYATSRFFVLWHKECALLHSFFHQPLPPLPLSLFSSACNALSSTSIPTIVTPMEFVSDRRGSPTQWSTEQLTRVLPLSG